MLFPAPPRPTTKLYPAFVKTLPSMNGKTVAITGCTSGTGLVLARTCGELGKRVIMLNRPSERADAALQALTQPKIDAVLVPLRSTELCQRAQQQRINALCQNGIDVLCNNAGVMALPDVATGDGFDVQMQSNHLSLSPSPRHSGHSLNRRRANGEARVVQPFQWCASRQPRR